MRSIFFIFLTVIASLANSCHLGGEEGKREGTEFPFKIFNKQLSNGLQVVTVPFNSPGEASFYILIRAGSRDETDPGMTGFAHFFEHMLFRGNSRYTALAYNDSLKSLVYSSDANASFDRTLFRMSCRRQNLEKLFEIVSDRMMHLHYTQEDFNILANEVTREFTENYANPLQHSGEITEDTAFRVHPYKHTMMGYRKDVNNLSNQYEYSLTFFNRYYRPEYASIVVTGDVTPGQAEGLAKKYFSSWLKGNYVPRIPAEPAQTTTRYVHVQALNFPFYLDLNYKAPAFSLENKDCASLELIAALLFTPRSDLYRKLVVNERKCRYIRGGFMLTRDPFLFSASALVYHESDMAYVRNEVTRAMINLKNEPVDRKLLDQTKSYLKFDFTRSINTSSSVADEISSSIAASGDPDAIGKLFYQMGQLTPGDIQAAAEKYFIPEHLTVSTITSGADEGFQ